MKYLYENELKNNLKSENQYIDKNLNNFVADCKNCFGLCCVALYFSALEGFPIDKDAGQPCINLQQDFSCCIHNSLKEKGLKGCLAFDCLGAGQKVSQVSFNGQDWMKFPQLAKQMFKVFLKMRQLHELLWYLTEALMLQPACTIHESISSMIDEIEHLTYLNPDALIEQDISLHQNNANILLLKSSELVRAKFNRGKKITSRNNKTIGRGLDYIGADMRKSNLRGENLRGAYLIAANLRGVDMSGADLIGADLRDADIRGANLTESIFLTQAQINAAKGDTSTKLPMSIKYPIHWGIK